MKLELPYPPSVNAYWRTFQGRTILSAEARKYKKRVQWLMLAQAEPGVGHQPLKGPCSISLSVYRPARRGDLDNTLKPTLDALRGVAYVDDSQLVEIHAFRFEDKERPRVVVIVEPAP